MKSFATPVARGLMAVGFAAALLYLLALALPNPAVRLATKAVPVLCLAAAVAFQATDTLGRLVAAGLVLSAGGDLLLELGAFLPGLAAFLVAHVAYTLAFLSETRRPALGLAIPFALYGTAVLLSLRPPPGPPATALLAYTVAICTMLWRAAARVGGPDHRAAALGLAGALLFAASDTLIALDRFRGHLPGAGYPIIVLYWLGQLGIAASAVPPRDRRRV